MNFRIKENLLLWISGSKKKSFPMQEVSRKVIFPHYFSRNVGRVCFDPIKRTIR